MQKNKNIPYYLIVAGFFMLLKFTFTSVDNDDLLFLLKPTDIIIRLLTGSSSFYIAENGYYHKELHILIDKSCSGFNFWILCFLLFSFLTLKYFDKPLHKILVISISLVFAYILTIFVNASRIFVCIVVQSQINLFPNQQHLVHETIGIVTNLSFLVLIYYVIEKFLIKRYNEKFT